jgi:hypothetical protein
MEEVLALRFYNFAALQAIRADAHALGRAVYAGAHWPQVNVPAPIAHVMRMRNTVTELRLLAANIANLCHGITPDKRRNRGE